MGIKCVEKVRKNNKIIGYKLESNGVVSYLPASELKLQMKVGKLVIDNLKLTENGRIIDKKESTHTSVSIKKALREAFDLTGIDILKVIYEPKTERDNIDHLIQLDLYNFSLSFFIDESNNMVSSISCNVNDRSLKSSVYIDDMIYEGLYKSVNIPWFSNDLVIELIDFTKQILNELNGINSYSKVNNRIISFVSSLSGELGLMSVRIFENSADIKFNGYVYTYQEHILMSKSSISRDCLDFYVEQPIDKSKPINVFLRVNDKQKSLCTINNVYPVTDLSQIYNNELYPIVLKNIAKIVKVATWN